MNILNVTRERQILCCSQLAQLHKARAMHTSEESGPKWSLMKKKPKNNPKLTIAQHWNSAFAEHLNISSVASPNDALYDAQIYKGLILAIIPVWQGQPCFYLVGLQPKHPSPAQPRAPAAAYLSVLP